jgi:hypothetical protein
MMLRVGNCEAEAKVVALMSTPRLGFTDNFFCVAQALTPHKIPLVKHSGAFWGQCIQRSMEEVVNDYDIILTIDYDSIFTEKTIEGLMTLLYHSGMDAIAPLQQKRESNTVMFALPGVKPEDKTTVEDEWFSKPVQPVETAHFGCTLFRTAALKRVAKPWFSAAPNDKGEWTGGHTDEDIHFWRQWAAAGNTAGLATHLSIGHAELMITWPSRTEPSGKVQQHTTEFWKDKNPPEGSWGFLK